MDEQDQSNESRLRDALSSIERQSHDLALTVLEAVEAGAPFAVITEAVRRGDAQAVEEVHGRPSGKMAVVKPPKRAKR